jgi:hypothetical protein
MGNPKIQRIRDARMNFYGLDNDCMLSTWLFVILNAVKDLIG